MESDRSIQVPYQGPALLSRRRYYWRVRVWDGFGGVSDWSDPNWYETALLSTRDWEAQWIMPDPSVIDPQSDPAFLLRHQFEVKPSIREARVYATAAGVYELYLNGSRVGDELLAPGWTSYQKRHQYQTYDVTSQIRSGVNAIGIVLANGWYKGQLTELPDHVNNYGDRRAALVQLHILYGDGTEDVVSSRPTWKSATGAILMSEFYAGENYDARLEKHGWTDAGFDDSCWSGTVALDLPYVQLVAQENWPMRVTERITPQQVIRSPSGDSLLDMGQNMVGRIRFTVDVPRGTRIRLEHAEVLDKDGDFYSGNLGGAKQAVDYVARGGGRETYAPSFCFMGFRYVRVQGLPEQDCDLLLDDFVGEVVHSDMPRTGEFACSNPTVNQLQRNIVWSQRGNFLDVPTDCPQRDERLGWTGDAQVFIRTAAFNFHVGPFFVKWLRDLRADQDLAGAVPLTIPDVVRDVRTSAGWSDAAVICPWVVYRCYGDEGLLAEQYDSMKAWVEFVRVQGDDEYLWNTGFHWGDWLGLDAEEGSLTGATPKDLIATAFYYHSTSLLRDTAVVLKRADDARSYDDRRQKIAARFREVFVTPEGRLASRTQTAHVLALRLGLLAGKVREQVARDLNDLVVQNEYHLTTGFMGTPYLCQVLSDYGYHRTAVRLLLQESYPSWLYPISRGATTIWEHWDSIKEDGSFWTNGGNSFNHYAYGAIGEWLYRTIAGLDMDDNEPAYKRILIRPRMACGALTWARATLESPYGQIRSAWEVQDGLTVIDVTIPANTTAEVVLPGARLADVREGETDVLSAEGIRSAQDCAGHVCISAGAGTYRFTYPDSQAADLEHSVAVVASC